jgi:hypothetical protein
MQIQMPFANVPASKKHQAESLYLQMEETLEANPCGGSKPDALHRIQNLVLHLKWTSSLFSEKAGSFAIWAEILYSPRKHVRWNTPHQSGATAIAHFMRCNLVSISDILNRMKDCP